MRVFHLFPHRRDLQGSNFCRLAKHLVLICSICVISANYSPAAEKLKALIVDGQNNHKVWPKSTIMMRQYLENSGLFETVDIARSRFIWRGEDEAEFLPLAGVGKSEPRKEPKTDPDFAPDFAKYDLVISNFGWGAANWLPATRAAFEKFVAGGGGFVCVHAANNSFPLWSEYNKMIGLGGWGDRTEKAGPYVYFNSEGNIVRDTSPGKAGKHAKASSFQITTRDTEHPITKGMPAVWQHTIDECYSKLRGPAENMTILATACDSPELQAAGRHEPMLMVIDYHKGRVFHTALGDRAESLECVGWITTFLRGAEWAAIGKVTQPLPADFPTSTETSTRPFAIKAAQK